MLHSPLTETEFRALAEAGLAWRSRLQRLVRLIDRRELRPGLMLLAEAAQRQTSWEAALAVLAVMQRRRGDEAAEGPVPADEVLRFLSQARPDRRHVYIVRGHRRALRVLRRTDAGAVYRAIQRLGSEPAQVLADAECLLYCMREHPEGGQALLDCLDRC
jgi:hypothetical protein